MSTLPAHAGRAPAGALPSPLSADPARSRIVRRTHLAVTDLVDHVAATCGLPPAAVDTALTELFGALAGLGMHGRVTVDRLAVALDQLGYDLVLTAEPREQP